MLVSLSEAKTNLSSLVNLAYQGEKIIITKHNLPMVDIVIHQQSNKKNLKKAFGLYKNNKIEGLAFQNKIRDEW